MLQAISYSRFLYFYPFQTFPYIYCLSPTRIVSVTSRETNVCSERETSGLICQSCDLLARCIRLNGNWLTIPVETCNTEEGFYCNLEKKGCSNATGPCHPFGFEGNFACTSEGVFPDPYDCQKYHMCYRAGHTLVSANIECGGDKAYSAATGDCSATIDDGVCNEPQYECHQSGDSQAWAGNMNIFYICKATFDRGERILYPTLYRCSSGEVFNGRDCIPRQQYVKVPGEKHEIFVCEKNGLFSDPGHCQSYYYCDSSLNWKKYTCPQHTHFDNRMKTCVRGSC